MSVLVPKRVKYRKSQRGKRRGIAWRGSTISMGEFALQALENAWVTNRQLEAARVALSRHTKGGGTLYLRVFPDKSVTKKPAETRMGRGKGMPEDWVVVVKRGRILFEIEGIPEEIARGAMRLAAGKLPIHTRFLTRSGVGVAS
ncbi:MAG: 50S ribosomal protein L16 [Candidatus Omnitrophica bacterium]|nr:50S ribosomal protein L16 [Candidatus Omnitrophota bacterium]